MNVIPGEPVPPGFEDELNREAEIQKFIERYTIKSLVGIEYTVELHEDDRREPGYLCTMCDKRGDPRTIISHWTSLNHRLKYFERHFPTAMREFNPIRYKPNSNNYMVTVVQNLADAIEKHHGRLKLSVYNADEFRRMKTKIVNEINEKFHFDEQNGPNFVHAIDRSIREPGDSPTTPPKLEQTLQITIKTPKRVLQKPSPSDGEKLPRESLDEISSEEDDQQGGGVPHKKAKKREQSPAFRLLPRVRRSPPFEEERNKEHECKKLPTPKELSLQASHIAQERFKWEKYRCMLEIQLKQMENLQLDYDKNPEKHPLYPEEWKKFWNRRYKELQAEKNVDPNKYDYKPEWIKFWTQRMKEIFSVECDKKKIEIKTKLGLPEDAVEKYVDQLKEKYKVKVSRNSTSGGGSKTSSKSAGKAHHSERNRNEVAGGSRGRNGRKRNRTASDVIAISDDEDYSSKRSEISVSPSRSPSYTRQTRSRSNSLRRHRAHKRLRCFSRSLSRSSPPGNDFQRHHRVRHRSGLSTAPASSRIYPPIDTDYYGGGSATFSRQRYPYGGGGGVTSAPYRVMDTHQYPRYERSPSENSKSTNAREEEVVVVAEPEDDGPLTVVAVLRLLTALEDQLGSLGPKVIDMLGKALALEKFKANSADDMLLNDDNCVFFETIKEKLKGLLIADVLDDAHKVRAVKKTVKNIAAIIHQVNEGGKKAQSARVEAMAAAAAAEGDSGRAEWAGNAPKAAADPSTNDLPFERQLVSSKLAAALIKEGREDITTPEMDKLIYLFVLMVKLSKTKQDDGGEPLCVADILPQLGIAPLPKPPPVATLGAALPAIVDELMDTDVSALVQEVKESIGETNIAGDREAKTDANGTVLESLTDSDLQTLLQNFKHLSREEQHHLIAHLRKLETADPQRVEKLRKFVNLSDFGDIETTSKSDTTTQNAGLGGSKTPDPNEPSTSKRHTATRRISDDEEMRERRRGVNVSNPNKFSLEDEDEDDDYNFDDVFKAASSNVKRLSEEQQTRHSKSSSEASGSHSLAAGSKAAPQSIVPVSSSPSALTFNPAGLNVSLTDTQNLIANLMGSLQQSNANSSIAGSKNTQPSHAKPRSSGGEVSQTQSQSQTKMPFYLHNQPQPSQQQSHSQQQQHQHQQQHAHRHHQQQQQQQMPPNAYGQAGYNHQATAYYDPMGGGYNNAAGNYPGYHPQQWGGGQQMQSMQQYGMQNYMPGQQPQQHHSQMGYNMYGRGGN